MTDPTDSPKDILTAALLRDATVHTFATPAEAMAHLSTLSAMEADVPPIIIVIGH